MNPTFANSNTNSSQNEQDITDTNTKDIQNAYYVDLEKRRYVYNSSKNKKEPLFGYYGYPKRQSNWVLFQGAGFAMKEDGEALDYETSEKNRFVTKTLSILFFMLIFTAGSAYLNSYLSRQDDTKQYTVSGLATGLPPLFVVIFMNFALAFLPYTRRFPVILFCLILALVCVTLMCACLELWKPHLMAVWTSTTGVAAVVLIPLFASCCPLNFTGRKLFMVTVGIPVFIAVVVILCDLISGVVLTSRNFIKFDDMEAIVLFCIAVVSSSVFYSVELQYILGGKLIEMAEDDYLLAAYLLYTAPIDVFIKLFQILGKLFDEA